MKTIVLESPGSFSIVEKDHKQAVPADSALIKIRRVAVCGTDLHAYKGNQPFFTYPRILGHEIAGEVVSVGSDVRHLQAGDLCAIEPYRNLEVDQAVRRGKTNCGKSVSVLGVHEDGAMREYIVYQADKLHQVNDLNLDEVAIIEPLAIGRHAIVRADIQAEDSILIVGMGPIGYGILMQCPAGNQKIAVVDISEKRLARVKEQFPDVSIISAANDVASQLENTFAGELPTIVIDATGNKQAMESTFNYTAAGGTIVYVGLFTGQVTFDDPTFHRKELTLKASRNATKADFACVIDLIRTKKINLNDYITHRVDFLNVPKEFESLYHGDVMKAIIDFDRH